MKSRTKGGIACLPVGNEDGTWWVYNLATDMLIRRDKFTVLPMPDVVVNYLDNMAQEKGAAMELKVKIGE